MNGGGNLPVGPGIWGFIAFFVLAIALWLLVRNMNSRLRRMADTDRERAQAAEAAARQGEPEGTASMAADGPESSESDVARDAARDQPSDGDSAPRA